MTDQHAKTTTRDDLPQYLCTDDFRDRSRRIANRQAAGEQFTHGEAAAALGLTWAEYAGLRSVFLALTNPGKTVNPAARVRLRQPVAH